MRVLITGGTGFVGKHLTAHLEEAGDAPIPTSQDPGEKHLDVEDPESIERALSHFSPDAVVHLAAQASVPESWRDPSATYRTNIVGTSNLLQALRSSPHVRVLLVGSGQQYEALDRPVNEDDRLVPTSPYSLSKIVQEQMAALMYRRHGVAVLWARAFNHTGPGQGPHYSVGTFCKQIVDIERGLTDGLIKVGYLGASRDFLDVRDVVRAYRLLLEQGEAGEAYNVSSGKAVAIRTLLQTLIEISGIEAAVEADPEPRAGDPPVLVGDPSKIKAAVGWSPAISLEDSLRDTLEWYRKEAVNA